MRAALLLVDLQEDYLAAPEIEPHPGSIVHHAARLLAGARQLSVPVIHVWTTVTREDDRRMPHWKRSGKWSCVKGTKGHAPPEPLKPREGELVVDKTFFSGFGTGALDRSLKQLQVDTLIISGVFTHACVRSTAFDAYERGYTVWIAADAVGSDDPLQGAISRRFMDDRVGWFAPVSDLLLMLGTEDVESGRSTAEVLPASSVSAKKLNTSCAREVAVRSPRVTDEIQFRVPVCGTGEVREAVSVSRAAFANWRQTTTDTRSDLLLGFAGEIESSRDELARKIAGELSIPLGYAYADLDQAVSILNATTRQQSADAHTVHGTGHWTRCSPLGVVGIATPWYQPVSCAVSKMAAGLYCGNSMVWRPAPASASVAFMVLERLEAAGSPPGLINLVCGDDSTTRLLMEDPDIDAISLSGSRASGFAVQDICVRRRIPFEAESLGINTVVVWPECHLEAAAELVCESAFGCAGQRPSATRHVLVESGCYDEFLREVERATANLAWGDPLIQGVQVGPLISHDERDNIAALVDRVRLDMENMLVPHESPACGDGWAHEGAYYPPTVLCCRDSLNHEVLQGESFGPILVLQRTMGWDHAIRQCNGLRHLRGAALFSSSASRRDEFLERVQAPYLWLHEPGRTTATTFSEGSFHSMRPGTTTVNHEFYTRKQMVSMDAFSNRT